MSTESQWDFPRWRDAGHTPRYDDLQQQHPQLSATQPTHQPGNKDPLTQPWYGRTSHDPAQQYTYDSRRQSQTYNTQQSHYAQPERHAQSGDYGPPNSTSFSNNVGHTGGPWRENPSQENVVSEKRFDDGPLSLQIPHKASGTYCYKSACLSLRARDTPLLHRKLADASLTVKSYQTLPTVTPLLGPTLRFTVVVTARGHITRPHYHLSPHFPSKPNGRMSLTKSKLHQCRPACLARSVRSWAQWFVKLPRPSPSWTDTFNLFVVRRLKG